MLSRRRQRASPPLRGASFARLGASTPSHDLNSTIFRAFGIPLNGPTSLQNDFGLRLGLADTTTWADFAKAKKLKVPEGINPKEPFVQVLDPALGTGTFLLRVIEVIHQGQRILQG